jgi:histone deacetylase 6
MPGSYVPHILSLLLNHLLTTNPQTDPVRPYINWAVKAGFGVIDVNIPFHITDPEGEDSYAPALPQSSATDPDSIENQCKELLCYLWDNYITGYDVKTIVIVGVGNAYIGAKQLLISRGSSPPPPPLSPSSSPTH